MKIHLVAGFLGSGKTTAIVKLNILLKEQKFNTACITNDQGSYLVDSKFMKMSKVPFREVTGGCFCCNYNKLNNQIIDLYKFEKPTHIFAESVGSCTDIIATVLKPMQQYGIVEIEQITFSTFVDAQILLLFLQNKKTCFESETEYIWKKQIEEAEILVVNKVDLISEVEKEFINKNIQLVFGKKNTIFQNSLYDQSVSLWFETINSISIIQHKSLEIDYEKYAIGEANLAWLDDDILINSPSGIALDIAKEFITGLLNNVLETNLNIGHMKFILSYNGKDHKVSFTTVVNQNDLNELVSEKATDVKVMVNARIQILPKILRTLITNELTLLIKKYDVTIGEKNISFFQPGYPTPTHRIA